MPDLQTLSPAWRLAWLAGAAAVLLAAERVAAAGPVSPPPVVRSVDLARYAGRWYEIARYPNRFQDRCVSDVTAQYTLRPDGRITVVNRCRLANGQWDEAEGIARRAGTDTSNAKLEVRFAPAFLSFIPAVWGDYWILDLAPDYSYAIVGSPDRKYLWVLARRAADPSLLARLGPTIGALGFDPGRLQPTRHTSDSPGG